MPRSANPRATLDPLECPPWHQGATPPFHYKNSDWAPHHEPEAVVTQRGTREFGANDLVQF
jgi:hypothetical protein